MRRLASALLVGAFALSLRISAAAATITIVNKDGAGSGLNDPTVAAPVGGNPGTTIGQQRLNVFKEAARIWGEILPSDVEIKVDASFTALPCSEDSGVLGGAGPNDGVADFPGAPLPGTWYAIALANKLSGQDQEPSRSDIGAQFNSNLGQTGCLTGFPFYYGFDTNGPSDSINFLNTSLHEFAHGLGFLSLVDVSSGELFNGMPDIFTEFILDTTAGKTWVQMSSDAERQASATNTGHVVWSGAHANAAAATYLSGVPFLYVTAPPAAAGNLTVGLADFGGPITQAGVSGTLVAAIDPSDASGSSTFDACSSLTNAAQMSGAIALVDRGSCNFTVKAANAQAAGAKGIVIASNVAGGVVQMGGTDPTVTIPVVSVSQSDGAMLRANLPAQVKIGRDAVLKAGMNAAGQMLLYAPDPVEPGSSISHWDDSASPNLLMEWAISSDLPIGVDLTTDLFKDIGWFGGGGVPSSTYLLTSVARSRGNNNAFFTSDVFVANRATAPANYTIQYLGHDQDGTKGPALILSLGAGQAAVYRDVLGSVFGLTSGSDYGALRITSNVGPLAVSSVTSTSPPSGTGAFGQSVPALSSADLVQAGTPATIVGIREEEGKYRTNLALANATTAALEVDIALYADNGTGLGTYTVNLPPLGMTQLGRIAQLITGTRSVPNATLVLSTPTAGGAFAAFTSLIEFVTNDPATLLPALSGGSSTTYLMPSTARSQGSGNSFFKSDFFIANRGATLATYTLKYLGHGVDGRGGAEKTFTLGAGKAVTYRDVLGSVFGLTSGLDYGAIRVASDSPSLVCASVTSTPPASGPGAFGQSVPAYPPSRLITSAAPATIVGVREEDLKYRTNLVLANATTVPVDVDILLLSDAGGTLGSPMRVTLLPLEMLQLNRIAETITGTRAVNDATLVLSTLTPNAAFAAFASLIEFNTNDPATLFSQ